MPRTTKTYDLEDEVERLENEIEDAVDEAAELHQEEFDNTLLKERYEEAVQRGNMLEQQYVGVKWALDEFEGTEVTLGGLTAGEYIEVGDVTERHRKSAEKHFGPNAPTGNARRMYYAAAGLIDGPFVDEEITSHTRVTEKAQEINGLAPQFMHWIEQRVDELTTPDVEGNGFGEQLEARIKATKQQSSPSGGQS